MTRDQAVLEELVAGIAEISEGVDHFRKLSSDCAARGARLGRVWGYVARVRGRQAARFAARLDAHLQDLVRLKAEVNAPRRARAVAAWRRWDIPLSSFAGGAQTIEVPDALAGDTGSPAERFEFRLEPGACDGTWQVTCDGYVVASGPGWPI